MNVSTPAIILRTINYLESSKIIYCYTKYYGKQSLVAKGARRAKSKFGSSLELCSVSEINYFKKSNKDLYNLTNAELIRKSFIDKLPFVDKIFCLMMCESIFKLEKDDNPDELFFDKIEELINISCEHNIFTSSMFIASQIFLADSIGHSLYFRWENKSIVDYSDDNEVFVDYSNCVLSNNNNYKSERKIKFKVKELNHFKEITNGNLNNEVEVDELRRIVSFFEVYFSYHSENRFNYNSYNLINN